MENPFREVLDTKGESFSAKTKGIGQPLKNKCFQVFFEIKESEMGLQYEYLYHRYRELFPELCEEYDQDELREIWNRQFGEE